jgi:serine/threonine protein kinase
MSSGSLPLETYHRAQSIGSGSFGDVMTVYNDDGLEFAMKVFHADNIDDCQEQDQEQDDDDEEDTDGDGDGDGDGDDDDDDESNEEEEIIESMDIGAMREVSILRLLRHDNAHANIISIHDFKQPSDILDDEDEETKNGDEVMAKMGLVMPLYSLGTLSYAIDSSNHSSSTSTNSSRRVFLNKRSKVHIAHGLLKAVHYLHSNGIIHRDIKGDNIMLKQQIASDDDDDEDVDTTTILYTPVLIDFSLAKIIQYKMYTQNSTTLALQHFHSKIQSLHAKDQPTHTIDIGTPTYKAPEVVSKQPYHFPSDMYSVGIVLLELLRGQTFDNFKKDSHVISFVQEHILPKELPSDKPFANLLRGLLEMDPSKRLTAKEALESELFVKFGLAFNNDDDVDIANDTNTQHQQQHLFQQQRIIDINDALPFDHYVENESIHDNTNDNTHQEQKEEHSNQKITKPPPIYKDKILMKRLKLIHRITHELGSVNPFTTQAALTYSQQLSELEDCDTLDSSTQALCDCVVLAHQFFEKDIWSLREIEQLDSGIFRDFDWSASTYVDTEATLFMLLDYCLYPREIVQLER